jgi:hypothetical protein
VIERIARHTAIACLLIALLFALWRRNWSAPLGVLGGGLLIAISFWAIRSSVDDLVLRQGLSRRSPDGAMADETGRKPAGFALVKFFTRHAIVALAAYGMMVRLRLDAVGLLAGVSSLGVAVAVEALNVFRWRRFL